MPHLTPSAYGESHFYHPAIPDGPFALDAEESHHLRHVLRLKEGALIQVTDGAGTLAEAEWTGWKGAEAQLRPLSRRQLPPHSPQIDLAAGMLAKPAFERLLDHVGQMPVSGVIPLATERTQIQCDCFEKLLPRYRRLTLAALKQSKKTWVTGVKPPETYAPVIHWKTRYDIVYLFESVGAAGRPDVTQLRMAGKILLMVGPEGGFSAAEVKSAQEAGIQVLSLGGTRLRAETAGMAAVVSTLTLLGRSV